MKIKLTPHSLTKPDSTLTISESNFYSNSKDLLLKVTGTKIYTDVDLTIEATSGYYSLVLEPGSYLAFYYKETFGAQAFYQINSDDNLNFYNFTTINGSYLVIEDSDNNTEVDVIEDESKLVYLDKNKEYSVTFISKGTASFTRFESENGTNLGSSPATITPVALNNFNSFIVIGTPA